MKPHLAPFTLKSLITLIVVAACFGITSSAAHAQQSQPVTPPPQNLDMREQQIRALEIEKEKAKRDPQAILTEINEDLHRLQALNDEMAQATAAPQQLNYKYVLDSTAEIKKRALRLKTDLALPQGGKEEKRTDLKETDNGQLQPGLTMLNKLLDGFLHNPIFSNADTGALDPHLTAQAKRDLEDIITLSEKMRKTADKLNKSGGKTQ
jgi:hypothetical protein